MTKKLIILLTATAFLNGCNIPQNSTFKLQSDVYASSKQSTLSSNDDNSQKETKKSHKAESSDSTDETVSDSSMYKYSTTLEVAKPELDEVTKQLVSNYQKNPTSENYDALRAQVAIDYDKVVDKKKAKLEELKQTAKEQSKITEMEDIVNEMISDRENRINQTMLRLTDSRLRPGSTNEEGYVPVMGAGQNIYISTIPVTCKDYLLFIQSTGYTAPSNWTNNLYPEGWDDYPVTYVSYNDALAYCNWMTSNDADSSYRLPTESEWELAAGHMPKDAAMNTGGTSGITSVYTYTDTIGASGAIDMWGNVWEWTNTHRDSDNNMAVKGGAFDSSKTDCRTEYRDESRDSSLCYNNVGFRIIKEVK